MEQIQSTSSPRDVFMQLLHVAVLYVSAGSLITLFFQYINLFFPDPLSPSYGAGDSIRWSLSILIVLYPVLIWTGRFLMRDMSQNFWKGDARIRKWLLYLTLFLAAILIIGDVVALIYNFLQGDLTTPFILKIVAVLVVAAAVFWHYLYELRRKPEEFSPQARWLLRAVTVIVIVIVAYGLYAAGSPFRQRQIRFDEQRVYDLQAIQSQLVNHWQQKGKLPASLEELRDSISGFVPPSDPVSGQAYSYTTKGGFDFSLCATFNFPSGEKNVVQSPIPAEKMSYWLHTAGETCFDRHIDPELYKPLPEGKRVPAQ